MGLLGVVLAVGMLIPLAAIIALGLAFGSF